MPYAQIIDNSDAILVGNVTTVSPTSNNQDSGQVWDEALPVFTLDVEVTRTIVGELPVHATLTITQVGYSPLEYGEAAAVAAGRRAVFFVVETEIAWRGGPRPVWRATNTVDDSIVILAADSRTAPSLQELAQLDSIIQDISARRSIAPQPTP